MRVRDGMFVLLGIAIGAGISLLSPGGRPEAGGRPLPPVPASRPPLAAGALPAGAGPAPAAVPDSPVPAEAGGEGGTAREGTDDLRRRTVAAELTLARMLLARQRGKEGGADAAEEGPGLADAADREALREEAERAAAPLLERWRSAAPGEPRAAAMRDLAMPMFRLLEAGGPPENLLVLEEAAERGETGAERKWAVIATHRLRQAPAVDFLLARARSPHPEVRLYAVEGLAWVRGEEMARAVDGVVRGLEDDDARVRGIAAISLGEIAADPSRTEAILARLGRETDPSAAREMAAAVLRLDPDGGRERVRRALETVPAEVRAAAERSLAAGK